MKKPAQDISLVIPVILVQEKEYFIISCDTLGVFAQSKDKEDAEEGFRRTLELFFNSLDKKQDLIKFLYSKGLITNHVKKISISDFPAPKLGLGQYTDFNVPAHAVC